MINSKRGVSGIIVTVLLILIAFAAVAIIWGFVYPFIQETLEEQKIKTDCLDVSFEITHVNSTQVTIKRVQGDLEIEKINIFVDGSLVTPATNSGKVPLNGESIVYTFPNQQPIDVNLDGTFVYKEVTCGTFGPARINI